MARGRLLYGEWLRRQGRRIDAREQLRAAHDLALQMGLAAVAERARTELLATGEKVRKRSVDTADVLTAQEFQIARLARDGLSNTEIGTRLFLSPRTVEWHLRRVFSRLDMTSRRQLRTANLEFGPAYQIARSDQPRQSRDFGRQSRACAVRGPQHRSSYSRAPLVEALSRSTTR